jgi:hypothetical protein
VHRVLLPRHTAGRNRFSLVTLAPCHRATAAGSVRFYVPAAVSGPCERRTAQTSPMACGIRSLRNAAKLLNQGLTSAGVAVRGGDPDRASGVGAGLLPATAPRP